MSDKFLSDCWSLHFHDPDDADWTFPSYKLVTTVSTVQDLQMTDAAFTQLWQNGMFFLMREHIKPLWEDEQNKYGGCLSFKVNKTDVNDFWFKLCALTVGETLVKDKSKSQKLCGISISPKRNYCIMRIWVSSNELNTMNCFNIVVPEYTQVIYKNHKDNNDFNK